VDNCYAELLKRLNALDMEVLGYTTETESQFERGEGILRWIREYNEEHEPISNYVVLDDEEFDFSMYKELYDRFVHTVDYYDHDPYAYYGIGLVDKYVEKALNILRGEIGEKDVRES